MAMVSECSTVDFLQADLTGLVQSAASCCSGASIPIPGTCS